MNPKKSNGRLPYGGPIHIMHLIEGARKASGLTVIIDVFRAFSLECFLFNAGVTEIRPVGTIEEAFAWRKKDPSCLLIGERGGKKVDGFDFGNSPSEVDPEHMRGRRAIHTTSAGTQGIVNAVNATEIITGSLNNARAVAEYIIARRPEEVSLVAMGKAGKEPALEDELCARYIESILRGQEMPDIEHRVAALRTHGGDHFFNPATQEIYPEPDFWKCIQLNRFPFIIRILKDGQGYVSCRENLSSPE